MIGTECMRQARKELFPHSKFDELSPGEQETVVLRARELYEAHHRGTALIEARELLRAASHALRSYQCGNAAPDLAEEIADAIDKFLDQTRGAA
jgi:hypothetical protein